jgi:hypothetical protein
MKIMLQGGQEGPPLKKPLIHFFILGKSLKIFSRTIAPEKFKFS